VVDSRSTAPTCALRRVTRLSRVSFAGVASSRAAMAVALGLKDLVVEGERDQEGIGRSLWLVSLLGVLV
jgi:hypothetical protein